MTWVWIIALALAVLVLAIFVLRAPRIDVASHDGDGNPALVLAAKGGHRAIVAALLSAGADVNARGAGGYTALACAAQGGYVDVVRMLLAVQGADAAGVPVRRAV